MSGEEGKLSVLFSWSRRRLREREKIEDTVNRYVFSEEDENRKRRHGTYKTNSLLFTTFVCVYMCVIVGEQSLFLYLGEILSQDSSS